jgi:hypothetical protein
MAKGHLDVGFRDKEQSQGASIAPFCRLVGSPFGTYAELFGTYAELLDSLSSGTEEAVQRAGYSAQV